MSTLLVIPACVVDSRTSGRGSGGVDDTKCGMTDMGISEVERESAGTRDLLKEFTPDQNGESTPGELLVLWFATGRNRK